MQSELTCPLCGKQYKDDNLPRLFTICGHTYCQLCIKSMVKAKSQTQPIKYQAQCPQDNSIIELETDDVSTFPKNIALIKVIEAKKNSLSFRDEESSINVSKIAKQQQVQEDDDTNELITAIKQGQCQNNNYPEKVQEPQLCLLHQKPLQIVCMLDLMRICANCAIFGQHKGHDFKSLEEIQNQRTQYYNSILTIMQKKQIVYNRISNKQTGDQIMGILNRKKQKMKKDINDRYIKLKEQVDRLQKENIRNLDNIIQKTQVKLQKLMKIDNNTMQKYQKWECLSFQHLKILEGNSFEDKLELLFSKKKKNIQNDVLETGLEILSQMGHQEENLIPQVQLILDNIGLISSDAVLRSLDSYVIVHEQLKKNTSYIGSSGVNLEESTKNKQQGQSSHDNYIDSNPQNQESLLEMEDSIQEVNRKKPQFTKAQDQNFIKIQQINREQLNLKFLQKQQTGQKIQQKKLTNQNTLRQAQKPNKKKLSKLKIPQKYQKIIQGIITDSVQSIDFTNAQLGDTSLLIISQFIRGSKAKSLKLIRNKLTDQGIKKMLPFLTNIITLNLSQNLLTDHSIDIFLDGLQHVPNLKNLILSQNKIVERKHKTKIDKLRKMELTVSI